MKCPQCGNNISITQIAKHTRWTPIICKECNVKLHFNKKEWYKITIPILTIIILPYLIRGIFNVRSPLVNIAVIPLMIGAFIKFFLDLKSIKLEVTNEK